MELLTKQLEKRFAKVGSQELVRDPVIVAKFFKPGGSGTWYATEFDPIDKMFFGYLSIFGDLNDEWGYFSLNELESYVNSFDIGIERDLYWTECKASKVTR